MAQTSAGELSPAGAAAPSSVAVFDGHNDTLLRLLLAEEGVDPFFKGRAGHIDEPKARAGRLGGGLFAVFVPSPEDVELIRVMDEEGEGEEEGESEGEPSVAPGSSPAPSNRKRRAWSRDHAPYSPSVDVGLATKVAQASVDLLEHLIASAEGRVRLMTTEADLIEARRAFDNDEFRVGTAAEQEGSESDPPLEPLRVVLHFEGAEPIREDLSNLEGWYRQGLRSLGLVWSRRNAFGAGVPFRFPSTPDHFEGLSAAGRDLVRECNQLGILVDLAHLNERGFWDASRVSRKPLVVTHSGALSVCPSSRNLTDDQIRAVGDSGGVIGVNLHCGDLRPDGRLNSDTPIEVVVQHVETILALAGPQSVALGSDFDGALMPRCLNNASRLPVLIDALAEAGWADDHLRAFAYGNWLRALNDAWIGGR